MPRSADEELPASSNSPLAVRNFLTLARDSLADAVSDRERPFQRHDAGCGKREARVTLLCAGTLPSA
jgi:hypothetical protein